MHLRRRLLVTVSLLPLGCSARAPAVGVADASLEAAVADASVDTASDASGLLDTSESSPSWDGANPIISGLAIVPNPNSALSAVLTFTTNEPTTDHVQVTNIGDAGADNSFVVPLGGVAPSTLHTINLIGMRASSPFRIDIATTDGSARSASGSLRYTTGALPATIPPITLVTNDKSRTSPGYTMMDLWLWDASQPFSKLDPTRSAIVIVDADAQVVWYAMGPTCCYPMDPEKLANGDIVFVGSGTQAIWEEIDPMGTIVRQGSAASMGVDFLSHEIFPEGDGSYLSLAPSVRDVSGYPTADGGTTTLHVVGDSIVEFDPDGRLLNQWSTFDMFDPHYEGTPSMFNAARWNFLYPDAGATKDWTHGNAVIVDPTSGDLVASSRTLSWIFKFSRNDGGAPQLLWRLGPNGDFTLTNANDGFQYNQHCPTILANGNILAFDDGDARPNDAGAAGLYSRAVEFSLDTTRMQATIVWQYRESPSLYSNYVGSAYLLPNGNVLIDDGAEQADRSGTFNDPTNLKFARIMEVTHDPSPTKVMEFDINPPLTWQPNYSGFWVYRAKRIPSLY